MRIITRMAAASLAIAVVGSLVAAMPAAAVPTCLGKKATIVGRNRNPNKPVELRGTSGKDVILGLRGWDVIDGRGGNDLICGGGGDDFIRAGAGSDKVKGGAGQDTIFGGAGDDRIWGGANSDGLLGGPGNDSLYGGGGTEDNLVGGPGNDVMDGGPGLDLAEFSDSPRGVTADLTTDTATGYGQDEIVSIEGLVGSVHDDILTGDDGPNMLVAERGNDEVHGLGGLDLLRGVGGDNLLDGGDGADTVSYNLTPVSVEADLAVGHAETELGNDVLVGIEDLIGSKYDDVLTGDDGDNRIVGNGGDDVIDGGLGTDTALFFDSRRPVTADLGVGTADAGDWGHDTLLNLENLSGSAYKDVLVGDDGPNEIFGGSRADLVEGRGGDDILIGGAGTDEADGGDGTDECDAEVERNCEIGPSTARRPSFRDVSKTPMRWGRGPGIDCLIGHSHAPLSTHRLGETSWQ